jgi:hypothetical protein
MLTVTERDSFTHPIAPVAMRWSYDQNAVAGLRLEPTDALAWRPYR